jgi:putative Holliday junction resolvase
MPALAALIREWRPQLLVVGSPAHADGSPSDMQELVKAFIDALGAFEIPIDTVDERFTSIDAEARLKEARAAGARGRITRAAIDSAAAVLIAERYLAAHKF